VRDVRIFPQSLLESDPCCATERFGERRHRFKCNARLRAFPEIGVGFDPALGGHA
jgi:hypothetical protein